jgi:hypothetical protein
VTASHSGKPSKSHGGTFVSFSVRPFLSSAFVCPQRVSLT